MMRATGALLLTAGILLACSTSDKGTTIAGGQGVTPGADAGGNDSGNPPMTGALTDILLESKVGVLLDEIPSANRDALATSLLAKDKAFWQTRAKKQVLNTYIRLLFRNLIEEGKGQLPLPPEDQWVITVDTAKRETIEGHDYVSATYKFTSTLLSTEVEAIKADAALGKVDGSVALDFTLPVDPELLLERTGFSCMDESDFPPNSVDTENAYQFFNDLCEANKTLDQEGCHLTPPIPTDSCVDSIKKNVGGFKTAIKFKRVAWDKTRADQIRNGVLKEGIADLKAMTDGVKDNRIVYRYYGKDSCAIAEGCVGAAGWRRLLQFTATQENLGTVDAAIGDVGKDSLAVKEKLVSFSQCHQHMHFNHYGRFSFGTGNENLGGKRAFCLESTNRYFNTEASPLTHPYDCKFQGTAAGWGDDYIAGLDCQWVDITPVETKPNGVKAPLTFEVNNDKFLCEGKMKKGADGNPLFEATTFKNENGEFEKRFQCDAAPGVYDNNTATVDVDVPATGGLVTQACSRFLLGEKRNCDFGLVTATPIDCTPGSDVTLTCTGGATDTAPVALRVCESSKALGNVPCVYQDALSKAVPTIYAGTSLDVTVKCPAKRDDSEPGGTVGVYAAKAMGDGAATGVTCTKKL